jgi:hypothetical protein
MRTAPRSRDPGRRHGGAVLNIKAPSTGTYAGVMLYLDRGATMSDVHINGNASSSFQGAFHLPSKQVTFNGTTGMQTRCISFVARRMVFSGNSNIQNQCPKDARSKAFDALQAGIVG